MTGQCEGELDEVVAERVGMALKDLDALGDFDPVAGKAAEGLVHAREESDGLDAGLGAGLDHEAGEFAGLIDGGQECSGTDFDVEDESGGNFSAPAAAPDEFAHLPTPTITDNTVPNPAPVPAKKKPSLAELFASRKSKPAAPDDLADPDPDAGDIRFANYQLPELDLLDSADLSSRQAADPAELMRVQDQIIDTLEQFGIKVSKGDITKGPTITRYELYPAKGVRVDKIVSLERDIARATRAERINILAPIPGKDTVGIEIANSKKVKVTLRELLEGPDWAETKAKIPIALGKDVYGKTIIADLAAMPHCLVAGATGSGKSVCINSIISSILYRFTPEQLRFVMIDPKVVEMQIYNQLPHLVVPVVTDPRKCCSRCAG